MSEDDMDNPHTPITAIIAAERGQLTSDEETEESHDDSDRPSLDELMTLSG